MKKYIIYLTLLLISFAFAKPAVTPEWVQNYRKVYPNSEYLAQRGSGTSAEKAKTDATAALSRYFQSNVNANLSTTMSSVSVNDSTEEKTTVIDDVSIQSEVEFFGLEYTEPFYVKTEKKWYCVVYMNREDAWQQYKPQIDIKKNSFTGLYRKLEKETDYLTKIGMCRKVWDSGKELIEKLEYGRIINPQREAEYQNERDMFSNIPVIYEDARQNCSIYININSDYNRMISTSLSTAFSDLGFTVSKNSSQANYVAEVSVDNNISGEDPLSIKPAINLKVVGKSGKTVYSCEIVSSEKAIGYTLESAQKKVYPKLTKELEEAVKEKLTGFFNF